MVGLQFRGQTRDILRDASLHLTGTAAGKQLRQTGGYLGVGSDDVRVPDWAHPLQDPAREQPARNSTCPPTKVNSTITYPKFLTDECLGLMRMILEKDPSSRIGILDILEHPFLNKNMQSSIPAYSLFKISR